MQVGGPDLQDTCHSVNLSFRRSSENLGALPLESVGRGRMENLPVVSVLGGVMLC